MIRLEWASSPRFPSPPSPTPLADESDSLRHRPGRRGTASRGVHPPHPVGRQRLLHQGVGVGSLERRVASPAQALLDRRAPARDAKAHHALLELVWGARYGPAGGRSGGAGAGGGGEGDAGAGAPPPPRALRSVGDDDPTVDLPGVLVPGGRAVLAAVGGGAGLIILREAARTVGLVADGVVVAGGGP